MTAFDLGDGRTRASRHDALSVRGNHPVFRGHQIPAWFRLPRGLADGAIEGLDTPRHLGIRHECDRVSVDVRGERRAKLVSIEKQIAVLRRQDRRYRCTRWRVLD